MIPYKIILGYTAVLIGLVSFLPYLRNIFIGKTKPHAFSWLVWSILGGIGFFAQVVKHGGAGSWVTGFEAFACFVIFLLALAKGYRNFTTFDWSALGVALVAIMLWIITHDPALSVILVTLTDAVGFLPTYKKAYTHPHEETASIFALAIISHIISLYALDSLSLATWLYPASLVFTNGLCFAILMVRRRHA